MPFGPTNAPPFYTAMMKDFKDEWDKLFILRLIEMKTYEGNVIVLSAAGIITIGGKKIVFSSKTIIDDISLWYDVKPLTLVYFCCVCEVFKKYQVSFC